MFCFTVVDKYVMTSCLTCSSDCVLDAATHQALAVQLGCVLGWEGQAAVLAGAARAVAELAKLDAGREACAGCVPLMRSLLRLLSLRTDTTPEAVSLQTQACRALGNICYENGELAGCTLKDVRSLYSTLYSHSQSVVIFSSSF